MNEPLDSPQAKFHDTRMRGFRARASVDEVRSQIDARIVPLDVAAVPLLDAAGRVLARTITAGCAIPPFDRASMDGYAVRGVETHGSDAYTPTVFRLIGKARPGRAFEGQVRPGECVEIATGAPIPSGADTVVPVESTSLTSDKLSVHEALPIGRHVGRAGEDVAAGTVVFAAGRVLRPQDLGVLSGLGLATIEAVRQPVVTILITGDELLPPGSPPDGVRFADMNTPMIAALVHRDGGQARLVGSIADRREALRDALVDAADQSDVILVSGGSSTGPEDHAPSLIAELGELTIHGVALRPASPTGLGFLGNAYVLLLPGNPVSCLCAYDLFGGRIIRSLGGRPPDWPYRRVERRLAHKLVSAVGRFDYARVKLNREGEVEPLAISGASILSSTTRADGFVLVPADLEGYPVGAVVTVWLYDH